ncbi:MAG: glycosyltransferase family 1 protein [Aquiluna sp.]|nr:glycosyltransferase family 1 protein [Aquiluna sp.]
MRVAIVTESFLPQVNGVTNSVVRVLETLKQNEFEAIVIAPTSVSEKHLGFRVYTATSFSLLQFPVAMPGLSITRTLEEFGPDVIHVAAPFLLGAQAIGWGQRNNVPTVAVYQTDVAGYLERYNLSFARPAMEKVLVSIHQNATLNLAPTKIAAEYLRSLGLGGVRIWGRGVDLDLFTPANANHPQSIEFKAKHAPSGELLVGFVGRLAAEKQVHRMAELFGLPNVRFVVIGDGPEHGRLESAFESQPVSFTGALTGLELARAYAALDVFVHFGTEETFGQTIQEAQASGVPVIAPNVGGPSQLITQGKTGLLADPATPNAYRMALRSLLENPKLLQEISKLSVESVQGRSWSSNNAKLIGYYEEAASRSLVSRAEQIELA